VDNDERGPKSVTSMSVEATPKRAITGFHQDDEGLWVAELECGHGQHMRHDPPWQNRPWVLTPEGRRQFIGVAIACARCKPA
jgi:hypothetical protein